MRIVRVALDLPLPRLFDYRADDALPGDVGRRVVVPFGKKLALGVIVELTDQSALAPARLRHVLRIVREGPAFSPAELELARFAADYYQHPLGKVLAAALPAPLRRVRAPAAALPEPFVLSDIGREQLAAGPPLRSGLKKRLLERLRAGALDAAEARALSPRAPRLLRELVARGWVRREPAPALAVPALAPAAGPALTAEQERALAAVIASLGRFEVHLLLGVTGSGKTEVYLRAVAAALEAGGQALLLVPEIALTPQLEARVRARFPGVSIATLHSALGPSERLANWLAAHSGRARILLGTRLAIFAPLPELALIVVDEEHDSSFKQAEGMRYSARDLAVARARQRGVPVVLGSATPALETYFNALSGRYRLSTLTTRIGAPLPHIECVDTRGQRLEDGLSPQLLQAIGEHRARGEQCLVFVNRRGYAPVLRCHGCGWISGCHRCAAHLVLHLREARLRCHHCGHQCPVPAACPRCGDPRLAPLGQGTQRVEAAIERLFPGSAVLRVDRDSVRPRRAFSEMRRRIEQREVGILIGTQILAKGHDFPHLALVGVLNADSALYSADFRAAERLFALLTQVAGRAGRGAQQGRVLIQTEFPEHPLYRALMRQDYRAFAETLLAERRQAGFPPFVHQALLRAEAPSRAAALGFLRHAAALARPLAAEVAIYDPVPAALPRRAGLERAQLLVQSSSRAALQRFLSAWYARLANERAGPARWAIDVDPLEF